MPRVAALIVIVLAGFGLRAAVAAPNATTVDATVACPLEADFSRYTELLVDDVAAAVSYEIEHRCLILPPATFVRIDHGSLDRPTGHVCVRPAASYECFWTYGAHIKPE
jgi:hypothetical protein